MALPHQRGRISSNVQQPVLLTAVGNEQHCIFGGAFLGVDGGMCRSMSHARDVYAPTLDRSPVMASGPVGMSSGALWPSLRGAMCWGPHA